MAEKEGEKLRLYLRRKRIKQDDFANEIGIGRSTLLNYLKYSELPEDFKKTLIDKGIDIVSEPGDDYYTQTDLNRLNKEYISTLERNIALQADVIQLLEKQVEQLRQEVKVLKEKKP